MSLCRLKISKMHKIYETVFLCYSAIILIIYCSYTVADVHTPPDQNFFNFIVSFGKCKKKSDKIIFWELYGIINHRTEYENNGLFRQSFNRTGNGNFININGFLDIMLSFHTAMGTGQGQGT